jgi:hypothetical protein
MRRDEAPTTELSARFSPDCGGIVTAATSLALSLIG